MASGILVPQPSTDPMPPARAVQSLSHWGTRRSRDSRLFMMWEIETPDVWEVQPHFSVGGVSVTLQEESVQWDK